MRGWRSIPISSPSARPSAASGGEADLTQEELAARAGISANYVGEIERGEPNPSALAPFGLARGLSVAAAEFFPR